MALPRFRPPGHAVSLRARLPRGRAKFTGFDQQALAAELPNKRFPLILNTGRILYHWHGGTMTRRVPGLLARAPELYVSIHPKTLAGPAWPTVNGCERAPAAATSKAAPR